jgi:hypothetical protein
VETHQIERKPIDGFCYRFFAQARLNDIGRPTARFTYRSGKRPIDRKTRSAASRFAAPASQLKGEGPG